MTRLRWRLADDDGGQGALFPDDELVERHVGGGEYRGLEFIHVNARRIINEVPAASRVPFRYTVNAYRGCSHACAYCMGGETPVLMADGRTKPLSDLRVGDQVYGTVRRGAYRRFVPTDVLAHWSTVKPAYRVALEDGTQLVASGDHRFLTDRGWKHVTGSQQGRGRRPHLTVGIKLMGTGAFAAPPADCPDYRQGYLCGLIKGDGHVGSYAYVRPGRSVGVVHGFRLALTDLQPLQRARRYLDDGGITTREFLFSEAVGGLKAMHAIRASSRGSVDAIREVTRWPASPTSAWCKGFLAGIFDAEGSYSTGVLRIANTDPAIIGQVTLSLRRFGFGFAVELRRGGSACSFVRLTGGLPEQLRFFLTVDPSITRKRVLTGKAVKTGAALRVLSVEPLGAELPLFDITTGTGDFIADGVVSHNCFARPTHEYLGLGMGEDFDRKLVVKVNAVERLRAEVSAARWSGEHIAMGTNTDPYQRCEGKYRLTQGIVRVLSEAANPFSVLTKSTLVLRDLKLLQGAARRTSVRANFSVGTLDESVWRATEPGTPHPRRRLEAVARLNDAGVACGVLVAPVLPGISDAPEQLEAVVDAAVAAGAVSVSAIALHLRPGVREHFLGWLAANRPELAEEYERRYRRAYLPARDQQVLSELVADLVRRARGRFESPRLSRATDPAPRAAGTEDAAAPPPPAATQLGLGV